jgi:DNA repair protein RadD
MITKENLIDQIPDGKKRELIGNLYVEGVKNYYDQFKNEDLDLDGLFLKDFDELVHSKMFICNLKLFSNNLLVEIYKELGKTIPETESKISQDLTFYYSIDYTQEEEKNVELAIEAVAEIQLHDFQERIRRKVVHSIFQNQKRFLIHMPTGSGKTRTAAEIILDFIRLSSSKSLLSEKMKVLWIAQSAELCFQAFETVKWIIEKKGTKDIRIGHFYENYTINEAELDGTMIVFAGIQKLLQHYQSGLWNKIRNETFLVVVDEAHRSIATQWIRALDSFVSNASVYLIGLTATPGAGNEADERNFALSTYYYGNKFSLMDKNYVELATPIQYLVEREFLANIKRIDIDSEIYLQDGISSFNNGDFLFTDSAITKLSANAARNRLIVNIVKENIENKKKILVFTCGLQHNRILSALLKMEGIECKSIDQQTKNRQVIIKNFKTGELNVLLNYGVLTTGFDAPKTDVCIIARPVRSIVLYSQMVGRILRGPKNKGNKTNTLYTIKDNLGHGDYDELFNSFNEFYK